MVDVTLPVENPSDKTNTNIWSAIGSIVLNSVIVATGLLIGAILGLIIAAMAGWLDTGASGC